MADFSQAFEKTMGNEGGYSDNPADRGGETYKGIARKFHKDWEGWATIDALKQAEGTGGDFEDKLAADDQLQQLVEDFYKKKFWDNMKGDNIPDQAIADQLFDLGVNMGTGTVVKFLQEGLNLLNRNQKDYPDIAVDGGLGTKTLETLDMFLELENNNPAYLLKMMGLLQGNRYIEIMKRDPTQQVFARGWLNRIEF